MRSHTLSSHGKSASILRRWGLAARSEATWRCLEIEKKWYRYGT